MVSVPTLNIRSGPGSSFNRVASVQKATELQVVGQTQNCDWLEVVAPGAVAGWISGQYVTLDISCSSIPVTTTTQVTPEGQEETATRLVPTTGRAATALAILPAPVLLQPEDNITLDLGAAVLEWSSVKSQIASNEYYIVTLQFRHGSDTWTDYAFTHETKWPVQEHAYLADISDDGRFGWSVQLIRATGKNGRESSRQGSGQSDRAPDFDFKARSSAREDQPNLLHLSMRMVSRRFQPWLSQWSLWAGSGSGYYSVRCSSGADPHGVRIGTDSTLMILSVSTPESQWQNAITLTESTLMLERNNSRQRSGRGRKSAFC